MNTKETLKRLHETFPDFDTDTFLKILDCYIEEPTILPNTINTPWNGSPINISQKPWENIIYSQDEINTTRCY